MIPALAALLRLRLRNPKKRLVERLAERPLKRLRLIK
jgi:hypothetical protein